LRLCSSAEAGIVLNCF